MRLIVYARSCRRRTVSSINASSFRVERAPNLKQPALTPLPDISILESPPTPEPGLDIGSQPEPDGLREQSKETDKKIEADIAEGHSVGVDSTPSIYVNDRRFIFPADQLGACIREELDQ